MTSKHYHDELTTSMYVQNREKALFWRYKSVKQDEITGSTSSGWFVDGLKHGTWKTKGSLYRINDSKYVYEVLVYNVSIRDYRYLGNTACRECDNYKMILDNKSKGEYTGTKYYACASYPMQLYWKYIIDKMSGIKVDCC